MISKLSKWIALFLCKEEMIAEKELPVCAYGLELIISTVLGFLLVILTGIVFEMVWQAVFFYLVFIGVRFFTGGYHADTHFQCKLTLVSCCIFVLIASKFSDILYTSETHHFLLAIYLACVFLFSPVEHQNAPLLEEERKRNRGISIIMAIAIIALNEVAYRFCPALSAVLTTTLFVIAMLMIIAKIKKRRRGFHEENHEKSA